MVTTQRISKIYSNRFSDKGKNELLLMNIKTAIRKAHYIAPIQWQLFFNDL